MKPFTEKRCPVKVWWILTAGPGTLIVALTLHDIFQDLFHPAGSGALSDFLPRVLFRLFRGHSKRLAIAGPLSLVLVILIWTLALAVGFALIYWGSFPGNFQVATGKPPGAEHGFISVLYFSLEVLTTLGLGDLAPKTNTFRMIATLQALVGFSLVTASVSWIVLLYPALTRMRTLARRSAILAEAAKRSGVGAVSEGTQSLIGELALDVIRMRVDLIHFPIIYYFYSQDERASLPCAIPHLERFAEEGLKPENPDRLRLAAQALRLALDDLAAVIEERFQSQDGKDASAIFREYAQYHTAQ